MKINYKSIFVLLFLLILVHPLIHAQEDVTLKIVIHNKNPLSEMKKRQISNLFLKKVTRWKTDQDIVPVDLIAGNPVRDLFSNQMHGKSVAVIKAYWQTQIFAGRAVPPSEKESDEEVLQFVNKNSGAIGYVSAGADLEKYDVKELKISD